MSARSDRLLLEDILERIQMIAEFTRSDRDAFTQSRMMQEAVLRALEIIGEASRNLSDEIRDAHSDVPWRKIGAFRNFVIHVYWDVKLERVWEIVEHDLPTLRSQVQAILAALPPDPSD